MSVFIFLVRCCRQGDVRWGDITNKHSYTCTTPALLIYFAATGANVYCQYSILICKSKYTSIDTVISR